MTKTERIYVAGHGGLVGGGVLRRLQAGGFSNVITRSRAELDLRDESAVNAFFGEEKPQVVIIAAAKVGGIKANNDAPVEFLIENLQLQNNIVRAAYQSGVRKLVFLGSSCIYPKEAPQPIPENALLTGPLERTNEAYAIAKIAGVKLCQAYAREYGANFISALPSNVYGPRDNFDLQTSHVLAALLRKAHEAKITAAREIVVWGTGQPRREFLHVDDLADAILVLLDHYDSPEVINVGSGQDISIRELAGMICDIVGYEGGLRFDTSMPDGTPRKLLDVSKMTQLGWRPMIPLREGITQTYEWFVQHGVPQLLST